MKPSGKFKVDKGAETAETAKWGDDLLVTVPGGGQILLKGFYNKSPNAPASKMVIEQKNGLLRKVEGRLGTEPSDSPNPSAQEESGNAAGAFNGSKGSSSSSSSGRGGGVKDGQPYQEGSYKLSTEKVAKKGKKKSDEDEEEGSGGFFAWLTGGSSSSFGALGLLGLSGAKKKSETTVNVSVTSSSSDSSSSTTIPSVSTLVIGDDTGSSASDLITKTASQTVSGTLSTTLLTGQTVQVSADNGGTWTAATATTGGTTFTLSGVTLSGSNTLIAKVVNASLAEGGSLSKAYVLDTAVPTATLTTGTYANTANATVQSSETGTAYLVSSSVSVTDEASITSASGSLWNKVTISEADTDTLLSLSGLADGTYTLYTVDVAGNVSTASSNTFTVDATATGLSNEVTRLVLSADTGISLSDKITKQATQTITGTLSEAITSDETVYVSPDGGGNWYAASATTGSTSFSISSFVLESGVNNSLMAMVVNSSNLSGAVYSTTYTLDTTAPTVSSAAISSASGSQNNTLNAGDVVTATATFSESVTVTTTSGRPYLSLNIGGTTVQAPYSSGSGSTTLNFSYTILSGQNDTGGISIDANSLSLNSGTIVDTAGNSATLTHTAVADNASYMVDTTAPTTTGATVVFSADTGSSASDLITYTAAQNVSGTLSANVASGETVYVSLDNGSTWTAATTSVGQSTYTLTGQTLTSSNTLKVKVTDAAGNEGPAYSQAYTLDIAAPAVPSLALTSDAGSISSDNITNDNSVTVGGVETGATWQYSSNSGSTWSAAQTSATTSFTLAEGTYASGAVQVRQTDVAGNVSGSTNSNTSSWTIDTTLPSAPSLGLTTDTGSSNTDNITSESSVTVSGVEAGATWQYSSDSGITWSASQAAATTSFTLAQGVYTSSAVQVRQTDIAGNVSTVGSNSSSWTIDTTAPTVSSVAITSAVGGLNNTLNAGDVVTATVTLDQSVTVTGAPQLALNIGGTTVQAAYASGSATTALTFTYTLLPGQNDTGGISIDANSLSLNSGTITDAAGTSATLTHTAVTDNASYMVDTSISAAPTGTHTVTISSDTGISPSDVITSDNLVRVKLNLGSSLTLASDEALQVSADGFTTWVNTTGSGTVWETVNNAVTLVSGTGSITARIYDTAGNISTVTLSSNDYTLDTTAPTVSSVAITSAVGGDE
jgi:hypothetical protein